MPSTMKTLIRITDDEGREHIVSVFSVKNVTVSDTTVFIDIEGYGYPVSVSPDEWQKLEPLLVIN